MKRIIMMMVVALFLMTSCPTLPGPNYKPVKAGEGRNTTTPISWANGKSTFSENAD